MNNSKFLKIILIALFLFFGASLFFRNINGDEAIIAEHSYWLQKIGYVKSEMFAGMGFGWEVKQFHYHKLFVAIGALFISIFDISLMSLRFITLISTLIFLFTLYKYLKLKSIENKNIFLIIFLLLFTNATFFEYAFIFRPEIMVMTLIFCSYFFLESQSKNRKLNIIIAGFLAGLATLTHLNGMISIISGLVLIILNKEYRFIIYFLIPAGCICMLYFWDISSAENLHQFIYQFTNDPNFSKEHFRWFSPFLRLIDEHKRFFHSPKEITFSILVILSLILNYKYFVKNHRNLLIYLLIMVLSLSILSHGKTPKYAITFYPYFSIIIAISLMRLDVLKNFKKNLVLVIAVLYFTINIVFSILLISSSYNGVERNSEMASKIEKNCKVMAREMFFFNEIKNFTIHIFMGYELKSKLKNKDFSIVDLLNYCYALNDKYIIIENISANQNLINLFDYDNVKINQDFDKYKVIEKNNNYLILKKKGY